MKDQGNGKFEVKLIKTLSPEQKKLFIVAPAVIGVAIIIVYFSLFADDVEAQQGQQESELVGLDLPEAKMKEMSSDKQEVFDDLENYSREDNKNDSFENIVLDPLGEEKSTDKETSDQDQLLAVQKQIRQLEAKKKTRNNGYGGGYSPQNSEAYQRGNTNSQNNSTVQTVKNAEEDHLEYVKRLREAKAQYEERKKMNSKNNGSIGKEFLALVYGDQYLLPGDRLELFLPKDTEINGKVYVKGTPVFAYININQSRVLLDITNIEGDRMDLNAEDNWDHREGIYSKQAGNLWRIYQQSLKDQASNEVAGEVSESSGVPLLGSAIQDLSSFFRQKRLNKDQKILLVNEHKVILKLNK